MAAVGNATLLQCGERWLQGRTRAAYRINGCARCTFTDKEGIYDNRETNWPALFEESMQQAGAEEKAIAISNERYHQGMPAITVIIDGGWSKRSHKHSYNAKSGVGIIIEKKQNNPVFSPLRTVVTYMRQRNKHFTVRKQSL